MPKCPRGLGKLKKELSVIINMTISNTNGPKMRQTHIIFLQWPVVVALAN